MKRKISTFFRAALNIWHFKKITFLATDYKSQHFWEANLRTLCYFFILHCYNYFFYFILLQFFSNTFQRRHNKYIQISQNVFQKLPTCTTSQICKNNWCKLIIKKIIWNKHSWEINYWQFSRFLPTANAALIFSYDPSYG